MALGAHEYPVEDDDKALVDSEEDKVDIVISFLTFFARFLFFQLLRGQFGLGHATYKATISQNPNDVSELNS